MGKIIRKAYYKKWAEENKEKVYRYQKKYREGHKEEIRKKAKDKYSPKLGHEYYVKNKERIKKWQEDYYKRNRDAYQKRGREYKLRVRYGVSEKEYYKMFKMQDGKCALCDRASLKRLGVDHDHKTGKVRKLLCYRCNSCLGMVNDSIQLLYKMADYLETFK